MRSPFAASTLSGDTGTAAPTSTASSWTPTPPTATSSTPGRCHATSVTWLRPPRPGTATAEYLDRVLTRITLPGSLYLTVVAIIPFIGLAVFDIQAFPLGGVGLLIMVGVALQTMQQIESQLMQRNYEGFLS